MDDEEAIDDDEEDDDDRIKDGVQGAGHRGGSGGRVYGGERAMAWGQLSGSDQGPEYGLTDQVGGRHRAVQDRDGRPPPLRKPPAVGQA